MLVKCWSFSASVPSMMQSQSGMINEQSRTGVTHDFADFLFHVGFVAVDFAFSAGAFFVLEGAFI